MTTVSAAAAGSFESGRTRSCVDASTVVVTREVPGAAGEVFLLSRTLASDFAGGAWVFPGGKLSTSDLELDDGRWSGTEIVSAGRRLGARTEAEAVALHVAAVRETYEECGVLLARRSDGTEITADDLDRPGWRDLREAMNDREVRADWRAWLAAEDLVLDLDALSAYARWVTPHGMHRRFDTRFFLAETPALQVEIARPDDVEMTAGRWVSPSDALAAHGRGEFTMIFPTIHTLARLAEVELAPPDSWGAPDLVDLRRILPSVTRDRDGTLSVHHPDGDRSATL